MGIFLQRGFPGPTITIIVGSAATIPRLLKSCREIEVPKRQRIPPCFDGGIFFCLLKTHLKNLNVLLLNSSSKPVSISVASHGFSFDTGANGLPEALQDFDILEDGFHRLRNAKVLAADYDLLRKHFGAGAAGGFEVSTYRCLAFHGSILSIFLSTFIIG